MRTAVLLAVSLLLAGTGLTMAGDTSAGAQAWRTKADAELLAALDAGQEWVKVQVVGPRIARPDVPLETREEWKAHWAEKSAPFRAMVAEFARLAGGRVTQEILAVNGVFVELPSKAVPSLLERAQVRRAGLDWEGATFILDVPGDPGIAVNLDQTIAKVQAGEMWSLGYRGEGVSIAFIDTGIRGTHEMVKNADGSSRVVKWYDATSANTSTPTDTHSHGTHVTTTAAGSNLFNSASQQGVAPRATIYGVRIFIGGGGTWEDAQEGLQAAFDMGAEITSNSWGGGCSGGGVTTAELAEDLQAAGMINVFAAGNSGAGGHICPGMVDNVTTVGAIDINEVIAGFSSRGPCTWPVGSGQSRVCPDVVAVGVDVNAGCHSSDTCYTSMSGTSMATPHVAGATALLQQAHKALKGTGMNAAGKQSEILFRYSAKDLGNGGIDNDYGWGLAKTKAAYDLLASGGGVNILHLFSSGKPVLRAYETNRLSLAIVNLGGLTVSGPMSIAFRQTDTGTCPPACDSGSVSRTVTAAPFTEHEVSYTFDGAAHPAGNYLVEGAYDYSYDGGSGMIRESGSFLLKKVHFVKVRPGGDSQKTGDLLTNGWTLANVGNENASQVRFHEVLNVSGFVPAGAVPPGTGTYGAFANPAPDRVILNHATGTKVKYEWNNIGEVKFGNAWHADANFVAGRPGSYVFEGVLRYTDETGRQFVETINQPRVVSSLV